LGCEDVAAVAGVEPGANRRARPVGGTADNLALSAVFGTHGETARFAAWNRKNRVPGPSAPPEKPAPGRGVFRRDTATVPDPSCKTPSPDAR
jgi:hypothetical protein